MKKQLQHSEMTEIECMILSNQGTILCALANLSPRPLSDELLKAAEATIREVDKYE